MAQFTDAQVAAYIRDNNLTPDQVQQAAAQFGIAPEQLARATGLLNTGDASIQHASQSYQEAARQELLNSFSPAARETLYTLPSQRTGILDERGDDIQTYKEVAKEGPFTYYQTYDAYGNKTNDPFALRTGDNAADFLQAATMFGSVVGAPYLSSVIGAAAPTLSNAAVQGLTGGAIGGGGTLLTGGSVEDALKNAVLAGGAAYGASSLFGGTGGATTELTDRQLAIADAKQLADAGLSTTQIQDVLSSSGFNDAIVNRAINTITPPTPASAAPSNTVVVTAPKIPATTTAAPSIISSIATTVPKIVTKPVVTEPVVKKTETVKPKKEETVEVVAPKPTTQTPVLPITNGLLSSVAPSVPPVTSITTTPPSISEENIEIVAKKPTDTSVIGGGVGGLLSGGGITTTPATGLENLPGSGENVEVVTDKPKQPPTIPYTPITQTPTVPSITNTTPIDIPKVVSENPSLSLDDILKIITSLSALGAGSYIGGGGGGRNVPFVAPTQTVPVNTDDYYKAIQQYYNTYLPEMPRDVATPLQQWYSGTFKV